MTNAVAHSTIHAFNKWQMYLVLRQRVGNKYGETYAQALKRGKDRGIPNAMTAAMQPERWRQFQRLMASPSTYLSYRQIIECLGWAGRYDHIRVHVLIGLVGMSYRDNFPLYIQKCRIREEVIPEIRMALIMLTWIRMGGANMTELNAALYDPPNKLKGVHLQYDVDNTEDPLRPNPSFVCRCATDVHNSTV